MNNSQIAELFRQILTVAGSVLVAQGLLTSADAQSLIGALAALFGVGLSIYSRREAGMIKATAKMDNVALIKVDRGSKAANIVGEKIRPG